MVCGDAQADVMWSELACSDASAYPTITPLGSLLGGMFWVIILLEYPFCRELTTLWK